MAEGRKASHEPLDVLDIPNLAYFSDGWDFVRVCFDAALGDDAPQELAQRDPEGALFQVQQDVEAPVAVEGFFQVGDETAAMSGLHDDVINIDPQFAPYLPFETELHTSLVCGPCVLEPKWHFYIAKTTEGSDEHGGGLVHLGKGYLVVA
jgi:hypothetical protein